MTFTVKNNCGTVSSEFFGAKKLTGRLEPTYKHARGSSACKRSSQWFRQTRVSLMSHCVPSILFCFLVFLGFTGTFFSNSEWGSAQIVLMIVLHWSKQITRKCTHLLPKTRSTHTVKFFFSLMTVYRFGVDPQ